MTEDEKMELREEIDEEFMQAISKAKNAALKYHILVENNSSVYSNDYEAIGRMLMQQRELLDAVEHLKIKTELCMDSLENCEIGELVKAYSQVDGYAESILESAIYMCTIIQIAKRNHLKRRE